MKFNYIDIFGLVIFKKAFFKGLQANTTASKTSLEAEVKELKDKLDLFQDEAELY